MHSSIVEFIKSFVKGVRFHGLTMGINFLFEDLKLLLKFTCAVFELLIEKSGSLINLRLLFSFLGKLGSFGSSDVFAGVGEGATLAG
jgi:hypothetical protein